MPDARTAFQQAVWRAFWAMFRPARIGKKVSASQVVIDANRAGRIWVTELGDDNSPTTVTEAINMGAPEIPWWPVLLVTGRDGETYVWGSDLSRAAEHLGTKRRVGNVGPHSHRIGFGLVDYVEALRFETGLIHPETGDDLTVEAEPFPYFDDDGEWQWAEGLTLDLTSNLPDTAGQHQIVVVSFDIGTGTLVADEGAATSVFTTLDDSDIAGISLSGDIPLGAVRLAYGDTALNDTSRFFNARVLFGPATISAARILLNTGAFNTNLSESDSDVQTAMETLDELVAGGGGTDDRAFAFFIG